MKLVYATRDAGEDRAGGAHCCRRGIRLASLEWVRPGCMDPRSVDPSVLTFFLLSCIAIVTALNPKRRSILRPSSLALPPPCSQKPKNQLFRSEKSSGIEVQPGSSGGKPSSKSGNQRRGSSGGDRQNRDHGERREKPPKVPGGDPTRQGKAARSGARGRSLARAHVA